MTKMEQEISKYSPVGQNVVVPERKEDPVLCLYCKQRVHNIVGFRKHKRDECNSNNKEMKQIFVRFYLLESKMRSSNW